MIFLSLPPLFLLGYVSFNIAKDTLKENNRACLSGAGTAIRAFMEVENFEEAMAQLAVTPANEQWQTYMSDLLQDWDDGQKLKVIPEMYRYVNP
jgi:L-rhamnose mutarotase